MSDVRAPSLINTRLKVEQATVRFGELQEQTTRFTDSELKHAEVKLNPDPGVPFSFGRPDSPIPPTIPLLCGEVVQHLRSALDYLVYELALLDSGHVNERTQFPIEDDEKRFWKSRRDTFLAGLSDEHVAVIEKVQPYQDVTWTRTLRDLSNADKHRTLVITGHNTALEATLESVPGDDGELAVKLTTQIRIYLCFASGDDIITTLATLQSGVRDVIEKFQHEF